MSHSDKYRFDHPQEVQPEYPPSRSLNEMVHAKFSENDLDSLHMNASKLTGRQQWRKLVMRSAGMKK